MLDMTLAINFALEKLCEHADFLGGIFGLVPPVPAPRSPTLHWQNQPVAMLVLPPACHHLEPVDQSIATPQPMSILAPSESAPASPPTFGSAPTLPRARQASPRRRSNSKGVDLRRVFGARIEKCPVAAFGSAPVRVSSAEEEDDDDA
ncbi:uncharacterized protein BDZ99DRAFT_482949 [Mytilinidion resinicola]|uniref:Uncharacterized protein n=1 Tax=Mytilinidion resinicola TaxID=574789 RepID=A0A6A6Y3E7_9PEZI|nr:uncharacterized protein BDZ99DRAFT_482949 [Mytilinidion resinicola]KAF2802544.1 hypothetical protein BDZ99DRAFT_482949 [Mytilinidion resinicola]